MTMVSFMITISPLFLDANDNVYPPFRAAQKSFKSICKCNKAPYLRLQYAYPPCSRIASSPNCWVSERGLRALQQTKQLSRGRKTRGKCGIGLRVIGPLKPTKSTDND